MEWDLIVEVKIQWLREFMAVWQQQTFFIQETWEERLLYYWGVGDTWSLKNGAWFLKCVARCLKRVGQFKAYRIWSMIMWTMFVSCVLKAMISSQGCQAQTLLHGCTQVLILDGLQCLISIWWRWFSSSVISSALTIVFSQSLKNGMEMWRMVRLKAV